MNLMAKRMSARMLRVNGPRAQSVYRVSTEDAGSTVVSYRMNPPTGRSGNKINPKIRGQKIRRFVVDGTGRFVVMDS
jgi:hypothetical protein